MAHTEVTARYLHHMRAHAPTRPRLWIALITAICFATQFALSSADLWHHHDHAHAHHHDDSHDDHSDDQGHQCAICAAVLIDRTEGTPPSIVVVVHMPLIGSAPIYAAAKPAERTPSAIRSRGPPIA